ncbi:MAG TPA: phytanoyl-CoA dioxygenase family protein [Allosphingosinicella sp.]|nr:phytanoyl-CoA dioxygenase family protein [Allosphingosinicella sp.]
MHDPSEADVAAIIGQIASTGFCVVPDLLSADQCLRTRRDYMRILEAERAENLHHSGHQRILHLLMKGASFVDFVCHPFILAVWRRYLGDDVICSTMTGNALWPGSAELYWHVDHPFWTMPQPYPTLPLAGQVIWMLDDFTIENGATAGIAGSHRRGVLPTLGETWTDDATILTGKRGSAVLADGAWWHTSRPNGTAETRCAVLATYIRSWCVTQEDMRWQLDAVDDPSDEVAHLLGANQYVPRRTFPY